MPTASTDNGAQATASTDIGEPPGPLQLRQLQIDPPLLNASGAFDVAAADPEWSATIESARQLGAYVTKTVTRERRAGNPQPWVALWAGESLVNSVGLANPGIIGAIAQWAAIADELDRPVVLSVGGDCDELAEIIERAEQAPWVAAYELNLSCPNVSHPSGLQGADPRATAHACAIVRARTERPVIAKLTAACSDLAAVARAAVDTGADAITAVNTMPALALDDDARPLLGTPDCGLSGPALHAVALRAVAQVAAAVDVPVIGIGGIGSIAGARRMLAIGASAIGVGTAAAFTPFVLHELAGWLAQAPRSRAAASFLA